jgi:hypothetical protein
MAKEPFFQFVRKEFLASASMENYPLDTVMALTEAVAPLNILSPDNVYRLYEYFRSNIPLPNDYAKFGEYGGNWADIFQKYVVANTYAAMERPIHTKRLDGRLCRGEYIAEDYWRVAGYVLAESHARKTSWYESPWVLKDIRRCYFEKNPFRYVVGIVTPAEQQATNPFLRLPLADAEHYETNSLEPEPVHPPTDFTDVLHGQPVPTSEMSREEHMAELARIKENFKNM